MNPDGKACCTYLAYLQRLLTRWQVSEVSLIGCWRCRFLGYHPAPGYSSLARTPSKTSHFLTSLKTFSDDSFFLSIDFFWKCWCNPFLRDLKVNMKSRFTFLICATACYFTGKSVSLQSHFKIQNLKLLFIFSHISCGSTSC